MSVYDTPKPIEKQRFIYRAVKDEDHPYFVLSRAVAQDITLSFEARGLLIYILSKPDHWKVQPKDLEQQCGKSVVYRILNELINARYIKRDKIRDELHRIVSWNYAVYENPLPKKQEVENQEIEKQEIENQHIREYRGLENTEDKKEQKEEKENTSSFVTEAEKIVDTYIDKLETGEVEAVTIESFNPQKKYTLMNAVCIAFKIQAGGHAQNLIKQLTGDKNSKGKRLEFLVDDPPMTELEILAFRDWYETTPRYKDQPALPQTAETLYERALEFRAQTNYQYYINRLIEAREREAAKPVEVEKELPPPDPEMAARVEEVMQKLLRGEKINE